MSTERQAFPTETTSLNAGTGKYEHVGQSAGMTLREWYAGMALIGILAGRSSGPWEMTEKIPVRIAEISFKLADEMMKSAEARRQ